VVIPALRCKSHCCCDNSRPFRGGRVLRFRILRVISRIVSSGILESANVQPIGLD
jgi:hypothetical protein